MNKPRKFRTAVLTFCLIAVFASASPGISTIQQTSDEAAQLARFRESVEAQFRAVAGPDSKNCGHAGLKQGRAAATACAKRAFKHHGAFYVLYDEAGTDSAVVLGIVLDSKGILYVVDFDDYGMDRDNDYRSHTRVTPCTEPIRVRVTHSKALACMVEGHWSSE